MPEVRIHGVRGDEEPFRNCAVCQTLRDEARDFGLRRGQSSPTRRFRLGRDDAPAAAEVPQAAPNAARGPPGAGLGVELQDSSTLVVRTVSVEAIHEIKECRRELKWPVSPF